MNAVGITAISIEISGRTDEDWDERGRERFGDENQPQSEPIRGKGRSNKLAYSDGRMGQILENTHNASMLRIDNSTSFLSECNSQVEE